MSGVASGGGGGPDRNTSCAGTVTVGSEADEAAAGAACGAGVSAASRLDACIAQGEFKVTV